MEGEEEPRVVDLELEIGEAGLVVRAVAVGAVDGGLLLEAAGVVVGEGAHQLHGSVEFGYVGLVGEMGGGADAQGGGRWGEFEIYNFC